MDITKTIDVYYIHDRHRLFNILNYSNLQKSSTLNGESQFFSDKCLNNVQCLIKNDHSDSSIKQQTVYNSFNLNYETNYYLSGFFYNKALYLFPIKHLLQMKPQDDVNVEEIDIVEKTELVNVKFTNMNIKNYMLKKQEAVELCKTEVNKHHYHSIDHLHNIKIKRKCLKFCKHLSNPFDLPSKVESLKPNSQTFLKFPMIFENNRLLSNIEHELTLKKLFQNVHVLKYSQIYKVFSKYYGKAYPDLHLLVNNMVPKLANYIYGCWVFKSDLLYPGISCNDLSQANVSDTKENISLLAKQQKRLGILQKKTKLWSHNEILKQARDLILHLFYLSHQTYASKCEYSSHLTTNNFSLEISKIQNLIPICARDIRGILKKIGTMHDKSWYFKYHGCGIPDGTPEELRIQASRDWDEVTSKMFHAINLAMSSKTTNSTTTPKIKIYPLTNKSLCDHFAFESYFITNHIRIPALQPPLTKSMKDGDNNVDFNTSTGSLTSEQVSKLQNMKIEFDVKEEVSTTALKVEVKQSTSPRKKIKRRIS